jgi:hypothetical protein
MRTEHTGIFQRTIPETLEEWFSGGGGLLGSVNSVFAVAECAKRARETFRKVVSLPEDTSTQNRNVILRLDSSRRPLMETQEWDENRNVLEMLRLISACCDENSLLRLENLPDRDLRNNPVLYDVFALLFSAGVFHDTLQRRETLVRRQCDLRSVDFLREFNLLNENLQCRAMHIVLLDQRITLAEFEPAARTGDKMRNKNTETNKKSTANAQEKMIAFFKLYEATSGHHRTKETIREFRKRFDAKDTKPKDRMKTPSRRTAQTWLAKRKNRVVFAP